MLFKSTLKRLNSDTKEIKWLVHRDVAGSFRLFQQVEIDAGHFTTATCTRRIDQVRKDVGDMLHALLSQIDVYGVLNWS